MKGQRRKQSVASLILRPGTTHDDQVSTPEIAAMDPERLADDSLQAIAFYGAFGDLFRDCQP